MLLAILESQLRLAPGMGTSQVGSVCSVSTEPRPYCEGGRVWEEACAATGQRLGP